MSTTRRGYVRGAGMACAGMFMEAAASTAAESPDLLSLFAKRQSVRRYKPDPVPQEHLTRILDAARRAPTSGNQQPWKFLVVRDPAKIAAMKARCLQSYESRLLELPEDKRVARRREIEKSAGGYFSAPVYVVVLTDSQSEYPSYNHHDGPLAAGYLMLAARALGYGTVYITDAIPEKVTREVLAIPDRYQRVCITPIGMPESWPEPKAKKKLEELVAYETL
ncbi:nitroreductase family protein [Paludibaculum fermentans]|uniref:nitroreductase family protein n=1 Tax=Paludibaculum fermentans TaxID=1473598 RepID=UPI003EB6E6C7